MVRAAILFFVVGLLSLFLGLYGVAGFTFEVGRLLLVVFLVLGVLSIIASAVTGKRPPSPPPL
jgi:uncharacterized membrane protein YtjA (UPF0391 family)